MSGAGATQCSSSMARDFPGNVLPHTGFPDSLLTLTCRCADGEAGTPSWRVGWTVPPNASYNDTLYNGGITLTVLNPRSGRVIFHKAIPPISLRTGDMPIVTHIT